VPTLILLIHRALRQHVVVAVLLILILTLDRLLGGIHVISRCDAMSPVIRLFQLFKTSIVVVFNGRRCRNCVTDRVPRSACYAITIYLHCEMATSRCDMTITSIVMAMQRRVQARNYRQAMLCT